MARPTVLSDEMIEKALAYIRGGWKECGDKVPSIVGLALELGISRETLHTWARDAEHPFSDIVKECCARQERTLSNGGLSGDFNPTITKLMLGKHGYHDTQDHRSGDGSMSPGPTEIIIRGADGSKRDD